MRIEVLGPLQVLGGTDGRAIEVGGARLRTLLIRLALDPGRLVANERLVQDLWEDRPPTDPAGALQSLVARLRRALDTDAGTGRAAIGSHPSGYRLDLPPDSVDAWAFERAAARGREALAAGEYARAAQLLGGALTLWRGDPLVDAGSAGFAVAPVARLHEVRLSAVEDRADAELALAGAGADGVTGAAAGGRADGGAPAGDGGADGGGADGAGDGSGGDGGGGAGAVPRLIAELTGLCASHPLRERLSARLMRALSADGHHAAALAVYDRTRRSLAEELGTDPGPELRDVHLWVLRGGAPAGARTADGGRGAGARAAGGPADDAGPGDARAAGVRADGASADGVRAAGTRGGAGPDDGRAGLPARLTSFVGRDEESAEVRELLGRHRLVTLTGPGGVGKTRLAVEAAAGRGVPGSEVRLVELAAVTGPGGVAAAVLAAVCRPAAGVLAGGLPTGTTAADSSGDPVDRIVQAVAGRPVLLLLDNCEHVIDEAAHFADRLLAAAPELRVLATSREPLGVTGEALRPVRPLAVPEPGTGPEEARTHPAVVLFADRAAAVSPGFAVDRESAPHVVRLCRELDGIPLAIELAAARLRSLTPAQLAERLDDRFRLLARGSRTALPRHRTLRAVIDWSWALLDEDERILLRRLSVFSGGATLADAHRVCAENWPDGHGPDGHTQSSHAQGGHAQGGGTPDGIRLDRPAVQDLLAALVDKSLVVIVRAGEQGTADPVTEVRYRLLETVREYAAGRLAEAGEAETVGAAHTSCFLDLAETAEPLLRTADQLAWLARLDAEQGNLDAALSREIQAGACPDAYPYANPDVRPGSGERALRLAAARVWPWLMRGQGHQAGERTAEVLRTFGYLPPPGLEQAHGVCVIVAQLTLPLRAGSASGGDGGGDEAAQALGGALVTLQRSDHPVALGAALLLAMGGPPGSAARVADEFSAHPDPWTGAVAQLILGRIELSGGRTQRAEHCLRTSLLRFRRLGDRWGLALALITLAALLSVTGDAVEATAALEEARRYDAEVGGAGESPMLLVLSGQLRARNGDLSGARAELERAHDIAVRNGDPQMRLASQYASGELARRAGDLETAVRCQQDAVGSFRHPTADAADAGNPAAAGGAADPGGAGAAGGPEQLRLSVLLHTSLGRIQLRRGGPGQAVPLHRRALELAADCGDHPARATALEGYAEYCLALGEAERSVAALGAAYALRGTHDAGDPELRELLDGCVGALGEDGFAAAWDRGLALPQPESLFLASG
ncbi:BTAD domain-containing putative transcriptional regulator [Kitasatospora sp. NPDC056138]|uniref:AfsR/SARP family transcriptional regulator n=1 Tax=Kitasatospora sp. NPDC056138 TaxID=3345724 RepID=UPI0035DA199A